MRVGSDGRSEKVLVDDWPEPPAPTGDEVKTRALFTGVTMRLTIAGVLQIAPLIQDVVKPQDAGRIHDALRDEPGKLLGTVFDWR